jgi:hypothetical protein
MPREGIVRRPLAHYFVPIQVLKCAHGGLRPGGPAHAVGSARDVYVKRILVFFRQAAAPELDIDGTATFEGGAAGAARFARDSSACDSSLEGSGRWNRQFRPILAALAGRRIGFTDA